MQRGKFAYLLAALAALQGPAALRTASADVETTTALPRMAPASGRALLAGGARATVRLALPPLLGPRELSNAILDLAAGDFADTPLFEVLDGKTFKVDLAAEALNADPKAWREIGADGVVKGEASYRGGSVHLDLRLYMPSGGASPVLRRELDAQPTQLRAAVHAFDNEIMRVFYKTPGSFGTRLVFAASIGPVRKAVYAIDSDGEGLVRLSTSTEVAMSPSFGPDGVYYEGHDAGGACSLFRVGTPTPVVTYGGHVLGAAFRGGRIAIAASSNGSSDVFVGDGPGKTLARVTHGGINTHPTFGPHGELAYVSNRTGSPQIYVDGKLLTTRGAYNLAPSWCDDPDGAKLVFMGRDGSTWDIFSVDPKTGVIRRITQDAGQNTYPACAPDGRSVAFFSTRGGGGLFESDLSGNHVRKIANVIGESLRWERRD